MKHWILVVLFLWIAHAAAVRAEPFEKAEVTRTINIVSLLPEDKPPEPAEAGDVIRGRTALKTGGDSRAELQFPDLTITRVGSNALFRFIAGARDITLDGGTMLFSSPKGAGGGKVQAGSITVAVTGSDFLISKIRGRVKVICLSHKVLVYFTANPKIRVVLRPGQKVDIAAGATKMPPATTIDLGVLLSTSMLGEAGGLGPFPSQALFVRQQKVFVPANDPLPGTVNQTAQAAQIARSSTNNNSPAPASLQAQVGVGVNTPAPLNTAESIGAGPAPGIRQRLSQRSSRQPRQKA